MTFEVGSSSNKVCNQEITVEEIRLTWPVDTDNVEQKVTIDIPGISKIFFERIEKTKDNESFSPIYVVPSRLRELSPRSFTPRVVSIGPLHKDNTNFKSMEARKPIYLNELLSKVGSPKETLENCLQKVGRSIKEIRRCYYGMKKYDDSELTQIMVMDGCFILHFISKLSTSGNILSENRLRSRSIALDLVLLENQIPFFVLQDIYALTINKLQSKPPLSDMLCILLEHVNPFSKKLDVKKLEETNDHYHILGLLHKYYQPKDTTLPQISVIPTGHSVVNLHKVGVKFKPMEKATWLMAMEFEPSGKPTLRMPEVLIDNFFDVVIRNLIAYEQYSPVNNHVTSYAMAMDMLADSPEDIAKLGESKIIINHLGSNEKASNMINSICKDVTFVDFYYIAPWKRMDDHYKSYWSRNFGVLKRTYFSSPWKTIALIVGIILFSINIVQFSFYLKDK